MSDPAPTESNATSAHTAYHDSAAATLLHDAEVQFAAVFAESLGRSPFRLTIGWAGTYDDLLQGHFASRTSAEEASNIAFATGAGSRVLLSGRGGAGKTLLLRRLAAAALEHGRLPILVDLSRWSGPDYELWEALGQDMAGRIDFLLRRFATPHLTAARLDALPPSLPKLVLVDGLSEVRSTTGAAVIAACDVLVRDVIGASVLVADRMVRRDFRDASRWQLGMLLPLAEEEIVRQLKRAGRDAAGLDDGAFRLLEVPFFLDTRLREGAVADTGTATMREYFSTHGDLEPEELHLAAAGALAVYGQAGARTFRSSDFKAIAGETVTTKLHAAGLLIDNNGTAHFAHHLHHDFLASVALAVDATRWIPSVFDVVSLKASSFDTIAMVLEQLERDSADLFVRRVYDWHPYAAGYAMGEGRQRGALRVSTEMELVVLAMLAIRRWEIILASRERAIDALSVYQSPDAHALLKSRTLEELFAVVRGKVSTETWFAEWRDAFTRSPGSQASDEEIRALNDADSIMGWTLANVLKRLALSDEQQAEVRAIGRGGTLSARWRVAHVLGAFPSQVNAQYLFDRWDNAAEGDWARFGATRSLVEMAARADAKLRASIFDGLAERVDALFADSTSLMEFERAVMVVQQEAPAGWVGATMPVLRALFTHATSPDEQERWRRLAFQLTKTYGD